MHAVKTPAPHQKEALDAIESSISSASRATVVMACGTGKTLLELWAAQTIDAKRTVVFVPTLNLLQQVFHEWRDQWGGAGQFRPLCVCSDSSVGRGDDEIELSLEDLDFPTSTHPGVINEFLDAVDEEEGARAVIFCTYQSANVLGTAMGVRAPGDRSLGLGIFDEAHKTVGEASKAFAFALSDKNLALDKRLFFTATPRVFDSQRRLDENGDPIMVSMDDVQTYGEQIYTLSFAEAAEREIIVPYKVLISVVDDAAISVDQLERARVLADGQVFDANTLAKQIALRNAMTRYGLKKAITFHSTVDSAENFSRSGRIDLGPDHPGGFSEHVSGRQKTAVRDGVMQRFREAGKAVVSNARCLTEGVDVPAVDLVAFMDTKKSKVDIVQAAGRAMRRAGPEKAHGYILLPLHLNIHDGESPEEALSRSDFSVIAEVLRALVDSDEALLDVVRELRAGGVREHGLPRQARHGSGIEFDLGAFNGGSIYQEQLLKAIQTRVVHQVVSAADRFIDRLAAFVAAEGHASVPTHYVCDDGYHLGNACNNWRNYQHRLTAQQRKQLQSLGFRFKVRNQLSGGESAQALIDHFAAFVAANGHAKVLRSYVCDDGYPLGRKSATWRYYQHRLTAQQRKQLQSLGFRFDRVKRSSDESAQALIDHFAAFVAANGHAKVLQSYVCDDGYLLGAMSAHWRLKADRLTPQQREQLQSLGFRMISKNEEAFQTLIDHLAPFRATNGHAEVPQRYTCEDGYRLGLHCYHWRQKAGYLTTQQRDQLKAFGFRFSSKSKSTEQSLTQSRLTDSSLEHVLIVEKSTPPATYTSSVTFDHKDAEFFVRLQACKDAFGDLDLEKTFRMVDGYPLGARLAKELRDSMREDYPDQRRAALQELGVVFPGDEDSGPERERMRA